MLLDRVVDCLGGLSGWLSGRPVSDPPKTPQMGPGLAGARNRQILNRTSIEKYTDFDGRRIREFCSSRTRPDLVLFRALGGIGFSRAAPRSRPALMRPEVGVEISQLSGRVGTVLRSFSNTKRHNATHTH